MLRELRHRGFTLVATVLLMVLLTVVALGMLSLASITLRTSSHKDSMATAQANARMALSIALGQLQGEAGPDQRITVRADILDADTTTVPAEGVTHPHWCAVWKSPSRHSDYELDQGAKLRGATGGPTWLVSGFHKAGLINPQTWVASTDGSDRNGVVLGARTGVLGAGGSATEVIAPLVNVVDPQDSSRSIGKYAYWISDEGIKAKLNLAPNEASADPAKVERYLAPASMAGEQVICEKFRGSLPVSHGDQLAKFITPETLKLVMGDGFSTDSSGWIASEPDFTTYSYSVLSNVRKGGLKTDLTAAFENSGTWSQNSQFKTLTQREVVGFVAAPFPTRAQGDDAGGKLWRVHSDTHNEAKANDSFRWHSLFHYYNLYKASLPPMPCPVVSGTPQSPAGLRGLGGNSIAPRWAMLKVPNAQTPEWIQAGAILPVPLGFKAELALSSFQINNGTDGVAGTDDDEFGLRLHYIPTLVMWNPYDVTLTEPKLGANSIGYIFGSRLFFASNSGSSTSLTLQTSSWTEQVDVLPRMPNSQGVLTPIDTFAFRIRDGEKSMAPGEVRAYGLDGDVSLPANGYMPALTVHYSDGFSAFRNLPLSNKLTRGQLLTVGFPKHLNAVNASYDIEAANGYPARLGSAYTSGVPNVQNRFELIGGQTGMSGSTSVDNLFSVAPQQIEGIPMMQRVVAYMSRAKGRSPVNPDLSIPTQGGPGTFFNTAVLTNSVNFWDELYRAGTGFLGNEEFQTDGEGRSFWGCYDLGVVGSLRNRIQY